MATKFRWHQKFSMTTKVPMGIKVPMVTKISLAVLASYEIWACFKHIYVSFFVKLNNIMFLHQSFVNRRRLSSHVHFASKIFFMKNLPFGKNNLDKPCTEHRGRQGLSFVLILDT